MAASRTVLPGYNLRVVVLGALALVAGVVAWRIGLLDFQTGDSKIDRKLVEKKGAEALADQGVIAVTMSCPTDIERKVGAKVVCPYSGLEAIAPSIENPDEPPPQIGRAEIRVTGFAEDYGRGPPSRRRLFEEDTGPPEFAARVIVPADTGTGTGWRDTPLPATSP